MWGVGYGVQVLAGSEEIHNLPPERAHSLVGTAQAVRPDSDVVFVITRRHHDFTSREGHRRSINLSRM